MKLQWIYREIVYCCSEELAEMIMREISKSDAFTKMTLPRTSIRHVIPARTRKRTSDVVHTGGPVTPLL